ncbi:MAG TPA: hypothetical protein VIJ40_07875 [Acidimicrobiales bacterium]
MTNVDALKMSENVSTADWIRSRLSPWESRLVSSIIPSGFESYVRILHPVALPQEGAPLVRWADVSRWSGVPLHPRVQWHEIALPEIAPPNEPPWRNQGPREGTLYYPDVEALVEDLAPSTSTPQECFFCLWIGYFGGGAALVSLGSPPEFLPAPAQPSKLVELPNREYGLFEGALEAATILELALSHHQQTPNLWWPLDRSWCVASEIDLPWTYVGGSSALIDRLLSDDRLEAIEVSPDDPHWNDIEGWLSDLIELAVDEVLSSGTVRLTLAAGTVTATWEPSHRRGRGVITTKSERSSGYGGSSTPLKTSSPDDMRRQISLQIHHAVLSLA